MLVLSWYTGLATDTGAASLSAECDSPVRMDCELEGRGVCVGLCVCFGGGG